jgi:DNA polymerase III epsilon subunit family exonuclease
MSSLVKETIFVAFDIETTGLTPVMDRIIEIGAVKFFNGKIIDTFQSLVDPEMPIPSDASFVNGITDSMVRGSETIDAVLPKFVSFLEGSVPVAHNAPFDVGFIYYDLARLKLNTSHRIILDTCAMAKNLFPNLHSHGLDYLVSSWKIKSEKLHRALPDARFCMAIFQKCLDKIGNYEHLTVQKIIGISGNAISFKVEELISNRKFDPLKEALMQGSPVEIVYRDIKGASTTRLITPFMVEMTQGTIMIDAFCHLRREKRTFRLDRIVRLKL